MTIIKSDVAAGIANLPQPYDGSILFIDLDIVLPTAAPVAGDLFEFAHLPGGVYIVDYAVKAPQLDSNGAPALAFSLGTELVDFSDITTVLETGLTPGRTANGSIARMTFGGAPQVDKVAALALLSYNLNNAVGTRRIALKVTTAAATWAGAGKILTLSLALRG